MADASFDDNIFSIKEEQRMTLNPCLLLTHFGKSLVEQQRALQPATVDACQVTDIEKTWLTHFEGLKVLLGEPPFSRYFCFLFPKGKLNPADLV